MPNLIKPPYVLFADDDRDTLELFKAHTNLRQWRGEFVSSARAIIDSVNDLHNSQQEHFDCVVADYNYLDQNPENFPRLTGMAAAREIRKTHPNLPIVFITAFGGPILKEQIDKLGSAELLEKPFDCNGLFRRIEFLVRWNRAALAHGYEGPDRRRNSINFTHHRRRSTDRQLAVPQVLEEAMADMRLTKRH